MINNKITARASMKITDKRICRDIDDIGKRPYHGGTHAYVTLKTLRNARGCGYVKLRLGSVAVRSTELTVHLASFQCAICVYALEILTLFKQTTIISILSPDRRFPTNSVSATGPGVLFRGST